MSLGLLLIILVVIFCVVGLPQVGVWNHGYGVWPSGLGFVVLIVLLILLFAGRL